MDVCHIPTHLSYVQKGDMKKMPLVCRPFTSEHDNHRAFGRIYHDQEGIPDDLTVPGVPMVWIDLAEDAFCAGRIEQAKALIETAYQCFDLTMMD
jgi:hypothetical protein